MNNREKLFEFLQKGDLNEDEKLLLDKLIKEDKEAKTFYNTYNKLSGIIKNSSHLTSEQIGDYVLYKNANEPENKNTVKYLPLIESHLQACEKCGNEFKIFNEEYNDIDSLVKARFNNKSVEEKNELKDIPNKKSFSFSRYAIAAILIIGILYASLFAFSRFTSPKYYTLVKTNEDSNFYVTRGRITNDFQKSLNALDEKNYNSAINYLRLDIKNNPNDETIFYSYYILGLVYLNNSENDFIGLFPHYNLQNAARALANFNISISKNLSGKFNNINLDAYFYSAKANLILNNTKEAKKDLDIVIKNKGSKMVEAQGILRKLE